MRQLDRIFARIRTVLAALALGSLALASQAGTTDIYYHNDLAGTPMAATDGAGNLLWRQSYKPYGERLDPKAPAEQLPWYTGKAHVEAAGLSYYGARWYDPALGRFMGVDPVGFSEANLHSFNRYAYANNNPYKFVDPDGRSPETIVDVAFVTYDAGRFLGAGAAWAVGKLTGNVTLAAAGAEGMRETGGDLGLSAAATIVPGLSAPLIRGGIKVVDGASDVARSAAEINRSENIAKGIPESVLGPSGKPKIHVVDHGGSMKEAKEAARREVGKGGSVEKHSNPEVGKDHFHGVSPSGNKSRVHHEFNN